MRIWFLFLFVSIFPIKIWSAIVSTESIRRELERVPDVDDRKRWILLDIDYTSLIPTGAYGSEIWYEGQLAHYKRLGLAHSEAIRKVHELWDAIFERVLHRASEPQLGELFHQLRRESTQVFFFTARTLNIVEHTHVQLREARIHFDARDLMKSFRSNSYFRDGVLFSDGRPKGLALLEFLGFQENPPDEIWLIDDSLKQLLSVEQALADLSIDFKGFSYIHPGQIFHPSERTLRRHRDWARCANRLALTRRSRK